MKWILGIILLALLTPELWVKHRYDEQFRDHAAEAPSGQFPLGTDDLGRDRLARLIYGSRISLLLAPAAALVSVTLAFVLGAGAAWIGGPAERGMGLANDLTLCLPWILLLMTVRAALPLDLPPLISLLATFLILGILGWAGPARVVRTEVRRILDSDFVLRSRAQGSGPWRILAGHVAPAAAPVLKAHFWIAVPWFILTEANLGLLGLGVSEPLPSWGGLLKEMASNAVLLAEPARQPWLLAPLLVQVILLLAFQFTLDPEKS